MVAIKFKINVDIVFISPGILVLTSVFFQDTLQVFNSFIGRHTSIDIFLIIKTYKENTVLI